MRDGIARLRGCALTRFRQLFMLWCEWHNELRGQGDLVRRPGRRRWMIELNMDNLMPRIQAAFKAAFSIDPASVGIETTPKDIPAWDSMGHVALVSSLEGLLGVSFDIDEVMEMEDVRQIARIAGAKLAAKTG